MIVTTPLISNSLYYTKPTSCNSYWLTQNECIKHLLATVYGLNFSFNI